MPRSRREVCAWKLLEQQVEIHDIPLLQQILQSDVIVFFQQVDIAVFGTPALTGHIGKSVAGSALTPMV